jgi:outer membrane protein assembly factor BamB
VWDNRIFILSAIGTGKKPSAPVASGAPDEIYQWVVICLDRAGGKVLWQKTAREEAPHEGRQQNNTFRLRFTRDGWQIAPGLFRIARAALLRF